MGAIGGEIEVRLKAPTIVRLKPVKERGPHFSGYLRESGRLAGVGSEQDADKDGRLSIRIRPKTKPDVSNFAGIKSLRRLGDGLFELRLIDKAGGYVGHVSIIARSITTEWRPSGPEAGSPGATCDQ